MLLQEIFKPEYQHLTEIYDIEIDNESTLPQYSRPPEHFEMIGFTLKIDDDGLIDEQLLDIIISYKLTNMQVIVEVPSQALYKSMITPKNLIQLASNVDFSISLLPPKHPLVGDELTQEQYVEVIKQFTEEMLKKQNFDKFVAPISNFMEYLMLEKLLGNEHPSIKNFQPDNDYVKNTFVQYMNYEQSNDFKNILRDSLYAYYGGEQEFNLVAETIFQGIYKKSQEVFTEHVNNYIREHQTKNIEDENTIINNTEFTEK